MKSLKAQGSKLSDTHFQLNLLAGGDVMETRLPTFQKKLKTSGLFPLKPTSLEIFQINIGKMCNQTCAHCHVDAGPDRKEIMTKETMQQCLDILSQSNFKTVDITGGAPEMNPNFRWFVEEIRKLKKHIIDRCNLTIILANPKYYDLPDFFKENKIEIVSSLPHYTSKKTDRQRGEGVFEKSIRALQMLNKVGYGIKDSGLILNLVYNPSGAFLPNGQAELEQEFKKKLKTDFNIDFNHLYCITNMPISRYLDYLLQSGNYEGYMERLVNAYNPIAAENVMCRNTLSIGWDGYLYDCDFNQMLDLKIDTTKTHITDFDADILLKREIVLGQHCFGCTAGSGSSCGGEVIKN